MEVETSFQRQSVSMSQRMFFEKVNSDFETKRARIDAGLRQRLDEDYPHMPSADKSELHNLVISHCPDVTGKSALQHMEIKIYAYVRDRYAPFMRLDFRDSKKISLVHKRVEKLLAYWRGEDKTLVSKSVELSRGGGQKG